MNRLTLTPTVALALALAAMSVPASAASYIPLGPKTYTPQPDIVTPQAPTITETEVVVQPATHDSAPNTSLQSFGHCPPMRTMNGGWTARTNVNADCTALSINPGSSGSPAVKRIDTTVTANPDIVTPQDPTCSQSGWSLSGGFGNYSC